MTKGFVAIVFVLGCAAGGVASQLAVPKARAGSNPTRWEYVCARNQDNMPAQLAKYGGEGWEMVSAFQVDAGLSSSGFGFCFKRALP